MCAPPSWPRRASAAGTGRWITGSRWRPGASAEPFTLAYVSLPLLAVLMGLGWSGGNSRCPWLGGNIVATVFAPRLGMPQLGWIRLGIGGILWLALLPLMLGRLFEATLVLTLRHMTVAGFNPGWWAFAFPLAAFTTATERTAPAWAGVPMLPVCTIVIAVIAVWTLAGARGFFRVP